MLILARECYQKIIITVPGKDGPVEIAVTLVDIKNKKARLGFQAPDDVSIDRQEVAEAKKKTLTLNSALELRDDDKPQ